MKKTFTLIAITLLIFAAFIAPTGAFTVSSLPTSDPDLLYVGTPVNAHMELVYLENDTARTDLIYQTDLENVTWNIKLFVGNNDMPSIEYNRTDRSGRISWFDLYQTNEKSYVDFTLTGTAPNYKSEVVLFTMFESANDRIMSKYESNPIPVYDKEQSTADFTKLKEELNVQNGYVNEMAQFSDVAVLQQMIGNYTAQLQSYENTKLIPKTEYDLLVTNMNSIKQSVINYQRPIVDNNLRYLSGIIKDSGYYNEYLQLQDKLNRNDFSDATVTKSKYLVQYVVQERQNKDNLKLSIVALIVVLAIGGIILLLIIRNKNRKQLDEIF